MALAILDDLGAIVIIALLYTADLSSTMLAGAAVAILALVTLNRLKVRSIAPYVLIGIAMWVFVLKSGVHATLAGVALAFAVPIRRMDEDDPESSPLEYLEHKLSPWVAFGVMPIFAFANAGVSLSGLSLATFLQPLPLGIAFGLFLGKQVGIFGAVKLAVRAGWAQLPAGTGWAHIYGAACLAGIGFTMSLFIGTLAFEDAAMSAGVRIGVLSGSILSALVGYAVLRLAVGDSGSHASSSPRAL